MERLTFLGMGFNFYDHDRFAVESQGTVSDRTQEHLGASDRGVIAMRRLMIRAIEDLQNGEAPTLSAENGSRSGRRPCGGVAESADGHGEQGCLVTIPAATRQARGDGVVSLYEDDAF